MVTDDLQKLRRDLHIDGWTNGSAICGAAIEEINRLKALIYSTAPNFREPTHEDDPRMPDPFDWDELGIPNRQERTMRQIDSHKVNGLNEMIEVQVLDDPGPGGACHRYRVCVPMLNPAEAHVEENSRRMRTYCDINFQNGPIAEVGVNGISNESLLAVLIDRMKGFVDGPYSCPENVEALRNLIAAKQAMHSRTQERVSRGVEGTSVV